MLRNIIVGLVIALFSPNLGFAAGPAVLIEEGHTPFTVKDPVEVGRKPSRTTPWTERERPLSAGTSLTEIYTDQVYSSAIDLRTRRRVGVGFATAGQVGLAGVLIELNFTPENSFITGFGGGPRYNAIAFEWKHIFGGKAISPYATLGFAHWYNSSNAGSISKTTPDFLANRFLTDDEKASGEFAKDFLMPSLGIQYNQLQGPYAGTAFFAEVVFLMESSDLSPVPTGALGALYYF